MTAGRQVPTEGGPVVTRLRVVVIGAGVAGLAAALALRGRAEVVVVEAADRVGGKLRTTPLEGLDLDEGAESFLAPVPEAVRLVRDVGLGNELVHPATSAAGLWTRGRLRPLPAGTVFGVPTDLGAVARSGVLSPLGLGRLALDLVLPRTQVPADSTVAAYVRARLGREAVERLVDPLLGGVYAGRADTLSLSATVPQFAPVAAAGRSLLRGAWRIRAQATAGGGSASAPVFASVRGGLGRLTAHAATASGAQVRVASVARALERTAAGWRVVVGDGRRAVPIDAEAVVLAVPGAAARRLLATHAPYAAGRLSELPYASIALTTFVYRGVPLPAGSGFLVPARERAVLKAVTYLTNKWPDLAGGVPLTVLRCSVGRFGDESDLQREDVELAGVVAADLAAMTGLSSRPIAWRVNRWGGGLPQYLPGHLARVEALRRALPPGLAVAGAAYDGVGIPACIRSGQAAAEAVLREVAEAGVLDEAAH